MKATIVYDNTSFRKDLQADWGFAALIEANGRRFLFDTGGRGSILLANMAALNIDLKEIDDIFISHAHFDHTGGLSAVLERNNDVKVWVPHTFRGVRNVKEVIEISTARELYAGIYTTGELDSIEQSLCIATQKGIVIVSGCSHPKMAHIVDAASEFGKLHGIIGGLHGSRPENLKDFALICATHCTQHTQEIMSLYPESYIEGGAGKVIKLEE